MSKTYQVPLTFEEIEAVQDALLASCGKTKAELDRPENADKKKLWFRLLELTSEERYTRELVRECNKYGYD